MAAEISLSVRSPIQVEGTPDLQAGETPRAAEVPRPAAALPISVIVPVRNEGRNLRRCLESLRGVGEIYVVDSQSTDSTVEIARSFGAQVVQFHYHGGWPKKRQWALDTLPLAYDWVLLLDADECLTPALSAEIQHVLQKPGINGYYIGLDIFFLGKQLRHSGATFYKLSLFRRACGKFECRTQHQDNSMCDMEVHEHVIVNGRTAKLRSRLLHHNVESISRYIQKHDEYSNWEARVWSEEQQSEHTELRATLFGTQAQRRRWLRKKLFELPGSPLMFFFYKYVLRFGFLDGVPGLIYCVFQGIQFFHIKAKIYELKSSPEWRLHRGTCQLGAVKD
jgi:glycosyltransferase involved in cell wall biosynthesis